MARSGWEVTVLEKHDMPGGRARQLRAKGFTFDMGPSWYWMPDVFERFFNCFDKKVSDYYTLHRLDPSYRIYFERDQIDVPSDYEALKKLFERIEPGSSRQLDKFLREAEYKYNVGINKLVYKPGRALSEFLDIELLTGIFRLDIFNSIKAHVGKYFKSEALQQLMEFPVLFLGALPEKIPALYSLMNYASIKGGTWYPEGGMYSIVNAMYALALELGVQFLFDQNVTEIIVEKNAAKKVVTKSNKRETESINYFDADVVIGGADYHHIESVLLPLEFRSYSENYWNKRIMAPSCLIYYIGINKRLKDLLHHSLFFDTSF